MATLVTPVAEMSSVLTIVRPKDQPEPTRLFLARSKLKASSQASALLAGFAMVAMVEMDLKDGLPRGLTLAFTICTLILISVHLMALMVSTCLVPLMDAAVGNMRQRSAARIKDLLRNESSNCQILLPEDKNDFSTPHILMRKYVDMAWMCSTVFGFVLFLSEVGLIVWVQLYPTSGSAAWVATSVLLVMGFFMLGIMHKFYQRMLDARIHTSFIE